MCETPIAATKPYCEGGTGTCEVCVGSCGIEEYEARSAASTRVLVPLSGEWQHGDVVKQCMWPGWAYMTLDYGGWRESTHDEIRAYEKAVGR